MVPGKSLMESDDPLCTFFLGHIYKKVSEKAKDLKVAQYTRSTAPRLLSEIIEKGPSYLCGVPQKRVEKCFVAFRNESIA
jgi:hypothetical protein